MSSLRSRLLPLPLLGAALVAAAMTWALLATRPRTTG